jgi:hypothetical protein
MVHVFVLRSTKAGNQREYENGMYYLTFAVCRFTLAYSRKINVLTKDVY